MGLAVVVAVVVCVAVWLTSDESAIKRLVAHEDHLQRWRELHPVGVLAAAFVIYVLVTGLSIPVATLMSMGLGWYLGFWPAVIVVSFGSTTGATFAFLVSRYLFRDMLERRFAERLRRFNEALERDGTFYLLAVRLMPHVPFVVINVVMGLTPMRTRTFWIVSQVGMFPATCLYVFAGSQLPGLKQLAEQGIAGVMSVPLVVALMLLGLFPLVVRLVTKRLARRSHQPDADCADSE